MDNYFGDFYPLSKCSTEDDVWMAWQFHRPDLSSGLIQAFRRPNCPYESARYKLHGLDPNARYRVTDPDAPDAKQEFTGRELMETGLLVLAPGRPSATILTYQVLNKTG